MSICRRLFFLVLLGLLISTTSLLAQGNARGVGKTTFDEQLRKIIDRIESGDQVVNETFDLSGANFASDKYDLTAATKKKLDKLVEFLERADNAELVVSGHTDDIGTDAYNDRLSYNRANAVRLYLMEGLGATYPNIPPEMLSRLQMATYGERKPLADNQSESGRASNRRVDFTILTRAGAYVQDLIILCAGDTLGVRIDLIEDDRIQYRDFSSDEVKTIPTLDVCGTRFAEEEEAPELMKAIDTIMVRDTVRMVDTLKIVQRDTIVIDPTVDTTNWTLCSKTFGKRASIIQLGFDFLHNLEEATPIPNQVGIVPPLSLTYEHGLTCNIGVGGTLAGRYWNNNFAEYFYYSATVRGAFHLPFFGTRLDPYVGISGSYRAVTGRGRNGILFSDGTRTQTNDTLSINAFVGIRYHLGAARRWGVFAEAGSDAIGLVRVGAFYVIRPPKPLVVASEKRALKGEDGGKTDNK